MTGSLKLQSPYDCRTIARRRNRVGTDADVAPCDMRAVDRERTPIRLADHLRDAFGFDRTRVQCNGGDEKVQEAVHHDAAPFLPR